jgi:signal transduction histidine kinase
MSRKSERLLGQLFKHDIGSPLNVAELSLSTEDAIDTLGVTDLQFKKDLESMTEVQEGDMEDLENLSELEIFEEFIGVAYAASERLASNYNLRSVSEEIQYLKNFDENLISPVESEKGNPREYVQKISDLAESVSDYVERTGENFENKSLSMQEVFETFKNYGQVEYDCKENLENLEVFGDESLCVVANTIAENAVDHGSADGQKTSLHAEINEREDHYRIDIWDDGAGLSDDYDEEEIFRRNNGDNSGLGLYLSREITELFDGNLEYSPENAARMDGFGLEWVLKKPEEYVADHSKDIKDAKNYFSSQ